MSDENKVNVEITATTSAFTGNIERAIGVIGALTVAFGALKEALNFVEDLTKTAEEFEKLSAKTGLTSEALSGLKLASQEVGVSFESFGTALTRLARSMEAAKSGSGTAADAYRALGVHVTDANGRLRESEKVLFDVADRFAHMENGAAKTATAIQLFGRAGAEMIPVLNQGRAGLEEMNEKARGLGVSMSGDTVNAARQFRIAMDDLHTSFTGIKETLGESLLPLFTFLGRVVATVVAEVGMAIRYNLGLVEVLGVLVRAGLGPAKEAYRDLVKEMEIASKAIENFWKDKPVAKPTGEGVTGADAKLARERAAAEIDAEERKSFAILAGRREALRHEVEMGQKSHEDELQQTVQFAKDELGILTTYAKQREALWRGDEAKELAARADFQKVTIAGGLKLREAQDKAAEDFAKTWRAAVEGVGKSVGDAFNNMINRTASFADGIRNIFATIQQAAFSAIGAMVGRWIAAETEKTVASIVQATRRITILAGESAAGAFTATVGTPFIGPFEAPAAAASAFATVLGFGASIASASGGYDIPSGVNPLTQLHAQEMVLPADLANGLRDLVAGGGAGGNVTVQISAMDGASVKRVLMDNPRALGAALRAAVRGGHVTGAVG